MNTKELLMNLTDDDLIAAENKAYRRYLEAKGSKSKILAYAFWCAIDDEMNRRCPNPFERKENR